MPRATPFRRTLLMLAACAALVASTEGRQRTLFRAGVEMVSLSVTVTEPGGRYVSDLSAGDFTVLEDGRPQQLAFFARATTSLAVSLLLDSSASMEPHLPQAQNAASEFVARLRPGDVAQVIDFSSRVQVLQPLTDDHAALERAIRDIRAAGSTSLYNAVYIGLRQLETFRATDTDEVRREVIVVLSDGEDTSSLVGFDEVMEAVRSSRTVVFTVGLGLDTLRNRGARPNGDFVLRRLAQESGGRLFLPRDARTLSGIYNDIAEELTSQYVLGYLSSNTGRDGWRGISVRVGRPNVQARTRTGYYSRMRAASVGN